MNYSELREAVLPLLNNLVKGPFDIWSKDEVIEMVCSDIFLTVEGTNPEPRLLTTIAKRSLYDFFRSYSRTPTVPFSEGLPLIENDNFMFDLHTKLEQHPVELLVAETIVDSGIDSTNGIAALTGLSRRRVDHAKAKLKVLLEDFLK